MKKRFSLALAVLMLLLSSCGSGNGTSETTKEAMDTTLSEEETTALTDGLADKDMDGFTFNILHHDGTWLNWAYIQLDAEEETGDRLSDAIYRRNIALEERFKADINITGIRMVDTIIRQEVTSGDNNYDIMMQYGLNVLGNVELLADFSNIPYLDLEAVYWNPDATDIFRIGEKQVAVAGNFTLSYVSGASCLTFNKQLYEDLQFGEDLYQIVRDGRWTTDKFFEFASLGVADLNGDGKMDENDRIGCGGVIKGFFNGLISGAGIKYVQMDEEHNPYFDVDGNTKTIDFMEKLLNYLSLSPYAYYTTSTSVDDSTDFPFANGQCLFSWRNIHGLTNLRDCEFDFGIVPQPKYDESQEKYISQTNIGEIATLPRSYDPSRAENIGMLLEAMSFYSQQHIVPEYREVVVENKFARDKESVEMLGYVFDGVSFDYGIVVWQNEIGNVFMNQIFKPRVNVIASTVKSLAPSLESKINALIQSVAEMP